MKTTRVLQPFFALSYPVHRGRLMMTPALMIAYVGGLPRNVFMNIAFRNYQGGDNDNKPRA